MAYQPNTDLLALLRNTGNGARQASMPPVDLVVQILATIGMINLWIGHTYPPEDTSMVWLKTSRAGSWTGNSKVLLWDGTSWRFATPALWKALLTV